MRQLQASVASACFLLLAGCGVEQPVTPSTTNAASSAAASAPAPVVAGAPTAVPATRGSGLVVTGPIIVEHQLDVAAQRDGIITKILADVPTRVKAGALSSRNSTTANSPPISKPPVPRRAELRPRSKTGRPKPKSFRPTMAAHNAAGISDSFPKRNCSTRSTKPSRSSGTSSASPNNTPPRSRRSTRSNWNSRRQAGPLGSAEWPPAGLFATDNASPTASDSFGSPPKARC